MLALLVPGVGMSGGAIAAPIFAGTIPNILKALNSGTYQFDLSTYFTGATSYSIAPVVEAGWSFDTNTAVLVIDTDAAGTFGPYVVTGTNASGTSDSNGFTVRVVQFRGAVVYVFGWVWDNFQVH